MEIGGFEILHTVPEGKDQDQDDQKKKAEGEGEALPLFHGGVFFSQTPFLGFVDVGLG